MEIEYYLQGSLDMDVEIYCPMCNQMIEWSFGFTLVRMMEICNSHSLEKHSDN